MSTQSKSLRICLRRKTIFSQAGGGRRDRVEKSKTDKTTKVKYMVEKKDSLCICA